MQYEFQSKLPQLTCSCDFCMMSAISYDNKLFFFILVKFRCRIILTDLVKMYCWLFIRNVVYTYIYFYTFFYVLFRFSKSFIAALTSSNHFFFGFLFLHLPSSLTIIISLHVLQDIRCTFSSHRPLIMPVLNGCSYNSMTSQFVHLLHIPAFPQRIFSNIVMFPYLKLIIFRLKTHISLPYISQVGATVVFS